MDSYPINKLRARITAGRRAATLLNNADVMDALTDLRTTFVDRWARSPTSTDPTEVRKRDDLHRMVRTIDSLIKRFENAVADGDRAEQLLDDMEKLSNARN